MATLLLHFPGRRYHATPWGHHVNEGLIEWPPSPWRLLRALLSTGYVKRHWPSDGPPPLSRRLIEKLASKAPSYQLPDGVGTHSRHYMPLARFKNGREDTTMVFDTWAQLDDGAIAVHWDVELDADERHELASLARELGYLGRSESWIDAELVDDESQSGFNVLRCEDARQIRPGWEQVAVLAPLSAEAYADWRREALSEVIAATGIELGKKKHSDAEKKKLLAAEAPFPVDLVACLQAETGWLRKLGWSQPPGSQKLLYWRPSSSLQAGTAKPVRSQQRQAAPVEAMLLAIGTASGNLNALPSLVRALPQGELLHQALVSHATRDGGHSVVLSGCDAARQPLNAPHQHAHLLHLDLDGDKHLDHVLIWAPMGLDAAAQAAIRATRRTYVKGGTAPLQLALAGSGSLTELSKLPAPYGDRLRALQGPARRWRSLTPFVPPRFLKRNGRNTLRGQIDAELASRGLPAITNLTILDPHQHDAARQARHFILTRQHGPAPPQRCSFMFDIEFASPIAGPLLLGYGSHYGLGVFGAVGEMACPPSQIGF